MSVTIKLDEREELKIKAYGSIELPKHLGGRIKKEHAGVRYRVPSHPA